MRHVGLFNESNGVVIVNVVLTTARGKEVEFRMVSHPKELTNRALQRWFFDKNNELFLVSPCNLVNV